MGTRKILLFAPALVVLICAMVPAQGPAPATDKKNDIDRLIQQLGSDDFEVREEATHKLAGHDDALAKLRQAAKTDDPEVRRRAEQLVELITKRLGDKAVQELLAEVNEEGVDRFIDRMATEKDYATAERWAVAYKLAGAAAARASKLSGRQCDAPTLDLSNMPTLTECPRVACNGSKVCINGLDRDVTSLSGSLVVSSGSLQHFTGVDHCVLLVNGDMKGCTVVTNSVVFCNGNLGYITSVRNSIILCTGEFKGSTGADGNLFDVHKMGRHTSAHDNVYINLNEVQGAKPADRNQFIQTKEGPLRLFTLFDTAMMGIELTAADGGAKVASVRDGSPFAKAGFRKGDLVLQVGKESDASVEAVRKYLRRRAAGDEAVFKVRRGDKDVELTVQVPD